MASTGGDSMCSSGSTPGSTRPSSAVVCVRHGLGEIYTSKTEANPFRRFVRCPERRTSGRKFFQWVDDELPSHYLGCVQRLKYQKETLETQLQYKNLTIETLYEKLETKVPHAETATAPTVPRKGSPAGVHSKFCIIGGVLATVLVAGLWMFW